MKNIKYIILIAFVALSIVLTTDSCKKEIEGCTNPESSTFNPEATIDDGTCTILGCMDTTAVNYNPNATQDDGSCRILGCIDSDAPNYDPEATEDDGSCISWAEEMVGLYDANLDCNLATIINGEFPMTISYVNDTIVHVNMELSIKDKSVPLTIVSTVKKNVITFKPQSIDDLNFELTDPNITIKGISINGHLNYTQSNSSMTGAIQLKIKTNLIPISDSCTITATKQQ